MARSRLIEVQLAKLPEQQQAATDQKGPQKKSEPRRDDDRKRP